MTPQKEISNLEIIFRCLGVLWTPGAEALKLQKDLGVRSLEETGAAAERAGYEVCYVDLPEGVSGFADVIAGKPHIVLNRAKSPQHLQYTLPHELAHHVLHLNPSRDLDELATSDIDAQELQAHLFATGWVILLARGEQRIDVLRHNPELQMTLAASVFMTLLVILTGLFVHLWSRLTIERK
jgi:Zn-dependent peptidase ImmA (M78 family)